MESQNNMYKNVGRGYVPKQYYAEIIHLPTIPTSKVNNPYLPEIHVNNNIITSLPNETYFTPLVRVNGVYTTNNQIKF